jgi:hypothetical protein
LRENAPSLAERGQVGCIPQRELVTPKNNFLYIHIPN